MIEGIIIGSVCTLGVIIAFGMIPTIKGYKNAEKKLKLKPGETFSPYPCNFADNPYISLKDTPVYTVYNKEKDLYWELSQDLIDAMDDDGCAALMESFRKEGEKYLKQQ